MLDDTLTTLSNITRKPLTQLKEQIIRGWPVNKDHIAQNLRLTGCSEMIW